MLGCSFVEKLLVDGVASGALPPALAFICHLLILGPLPLEGLRHPIFPGNSQFEQDAQFFLAPGQVSGLSVVSAMISGNLSCLPRWTFSRQSCTVASRPPGWLRCWCGFCPASTKWWTASVVAAVYSCRYQCCDDLCSDLQHVVMSPMTRTLIQCGSDFHDIF